ncbi:MAG: hypothetical protein LBB22_01075 [Treponema sp.]|jgi:hypothetical protein|nr:hypothetical protein [Treponema sp.]
MTTIIDGNIADITFETEKNIGDALSGIEKWAGDSGFCLSRVRVDDAEIAAGNIDVIFARDIKDVNTLNIVTRPFAALYGEALAELSAILGSWLESEKRRPEIESGWQESPAYTFLREHDKQIFEILAGGFSEETVKIAVDTARIHSLEAENPAAVFFEMGCELNEEVERLTDLPLDLQTGNDKRAAETVKSFSDFIQKMFRLIPLLKYAIAEKPDIAGNSLFDEFKSALKEFLAAYENKDMVLSGDLAEYEIAPRIKDVYAALKKNLILLGT